MSDPITIAGKLQFDYKENIPLNTSRNYLVRKKSKKTRNHLKIKTITINKKEKKYCVKKIYVHH